MCLSLRKNKMTETCKYRVKFYLKLWMYTEGFSNQFPSTAELLVIHKLLKSAEQHIIILKL